MIGKILNMALQPVRDVVDVLDGLSEGELREKAAVRLGAEVVSGMAIGAVISYLKGDNDE